MAMNEEPSQIRLLGPADKDQFWALRLRALKEEPHAFGASYDEALETTDSEIEKRLTASSDSFVLGAFNPQLVGMIGFYRRGGKKLRHKGNIWGMYVAGEGRGLGLGRALLSETIVRASKLPGLSHVTLSVVTSNEAAVSLYESQGFQTYGIESAALQVDNQLLDELLMSLTVSSDQTYSGLLL